MTIALVTAVPQGIILASESRTINGSPEWYANFEKGVYSNDFKVLEGEHPKVHKVGRWGLIYSGVSSLTLSGFGLTSDWTSDQEIANLQRMAAQGCSFRVLAETFYKRLSTVLNGRGFSFVLCGYDVGGNQIWAEGSSDKPFSINGGPGVRPYYCMQALGTVDVISKLISDEVIRFEAMSLQEALTFTLLTISVGCKYLKWFDRLPAVSGGPIYIAVITPGGGIQGFKFPEYDPAVPGGAIPWPMPEVALQNGSAMLGGGTCGREIGGNIYASTFRTSTQDSDTYITLTPEGTLESYYQGKQNIGMYANQNWGNMIFHYDGNQAGQLYATSDYDPVLGGTTRRLVVWSKADGSLRLQGPGIELSSNYVNLAGGSSAQINVRGKIVDNLVPYTHNTGYVGYSDQRWNSGYFNILRATNLSQGDTCFEETACPLCEKAFAPGDTIVLLVRHIDEDFLGSMCIPVHVGCQGIHKVLTREIQETEELYRFKEDGTVETYREPKFEEVEEQIYQIKEGYKLDKYTGQFKKKEVMARAELPGIQEAVEFSPEKVVTKEEAVELVTVRRKKPVMKTITVELNATAGTEPAETAVPDTEPAGMTDSIILNAGE